MERDSHVGFNHINFVASAGKGDRDIDSEAGVNCRVEQTGPGRRADIEFDVKLYYSKLST